MAGEQTVIELLGLDDGTTALGLSGATGYLFKGALALSTSVIGSLTDTSNLGEPVDSEIISDERYPGVNHG
jgi:hypothetical protein